jgi:hypothetical protein
MHRHIPFALSINGTLVTIDQVERGLKCYCTCPGCGERLIAKKGEVNTAHFAHESGGQCVGGYESSVHLAVKEIIQKLKMITLPECNFLIYGGQGRDRHFYEHTNPINIYRSIEEFEYKTKDLLAYSNIPSRKFEFNKVDLEVNLGDVRPDIVCSFGETKLFIEVAFTHFVDEFKLLKLNARGVSTLEIDVSNFHACNLSFEILEELILSNGPQKKWLLNARAEHIAKANSMQLADRKRVYENAIALRTKEIQEQQAKRVKEIKEAQEFRDKQIAAKFGTTHEAMFILSRQHIKIKLCKANTSVTIKHLDMQSPLISKMKNLKEIHKGRYIEKYRTWEFQPSLDLFYTLANIFNNDSKFIKWICPDEQTEEFFLRITERKNLPDQVVKTILPLENYFGLSPAMAALARARSAISSSVQAEKTYDLPQFDSVNTNVIVYYSTKTDFLSLNGATDLAWEECKLRQINRNAQTHPGWHYVDFDLRSFLNWLGMGVDSERQREIWAEENIKSGWLIP